MNTEKPERAPKNKKKTNILQLKEIKPLTINQNKTFKAYDNEKNLFLHGTAGTGKTFIALYLALDEILYPDQDNLYKSLIIVRSIVPSREIGFLPGSSAEKAYEYETPYHTLCSELFDLPDAYKMLKGRDIVEFMTTSFIRGITLNDCIVIVDEVQNMDYGELSTIITRIGNNCKIIFCGDFKQSDFRYHDREYKKDIIKFMDIIKAMPNNFEFVEFNIGDIVRSELVKNFLIAEEKYDSYVRTPTTSPTQLSESGNSR